MKKTDPFLLLIYVIVGVVLSASAPTVWSALALIFTNMLISISVYKVDLKIFKKIIYIIPFGGSIAGLQPFIRGDEVIYTFWVVNIRSEGLEFGLLLFSRLLSAFTFISLMASLREYEILRAMSRLKIPKEFIFLLSLTTRYLMEFRLTLRRMKECAASRGFQLSSIPYRKKLNMISYLMGSLIINAITQADRTYEAMSSRGFTVNSQIFLRKSKIDTKQVITSAILIFFLIFTSIFSLLFHVK